MFKKLSQKIVYESQWMKVYEDEIEFPNENKGQYSYVERKDGTILLVVNSKNEVLLVKQYRYPIKDYERGLPGGAIDDGETPEEAGIRELAEETGIEASHLEKLGEFYPLSSCSTEKDILFLTKIDNLSVEMTGNQADESFKERKFVSLNNAIKMIDQGEITEAYTSNALQILARKMKI